MNQAVDTSPMRMFYIDDSGAEDTGYVVYSWIETSPQLWRVGLRHWLDLRRDLYARYKIPPATELHATKFAAGRQHPSTDPAFNASKTLRRDVMQQALGVIGASDALRVGTVYRKTTARRKAYHQERQSLYADLITSLDTQLIADGHLGLVYMDGNGTDRGYNNAHRALKLDTRAIIEDPMFQSSTASQWMQMADFAAWTAYQSLLRHPGKKWAWSWYRAYLGGSDVYGGPQPM
ncbi:MAG: hypothetical protein QOE23_1466 [Pseudonocardiales bacterium]|nr:hypothetical protein [Pseudonocardiales bacterium]